MVGKPEVRSIPQVFLIGSFNNAPLMLACRADSGLTSIDKIRPAPKPPRIQGGSGSISFIFSSLVEEALNIEFQNVMGYKSGRKSISRWNAAKPTAAPARHHGATIALAGMAGEALHEFRRATRSEKAACCPRICRRSTNSQLRRQSRC
jgi:hypothetical protein